MRWCVQSLYVLLTHALLKLFQCETVKAALHTWTEAMLAPDMCLPHGCFTAVAAIARCAAAAVSPFGQR